ncbi:UNVERIFIED_CONTAM: hypothetical protein K2H54_036057 [Gekko kuhli]
MVPDFGDVSNFLYHPWGLGHPVMSNRSEAATSLHTFPLFKRFGNEVSEIILPRTTAFIASRTMSGETPHEEFNSK